MHLRSCRLRLLFAVAAATSLATFARAGDHILTFGGGPTPGENQTSLEQNVLYFQRVLGALHCESVPHDIYFADGATKNRTLQFRAPPTDDDLPALLAAVYQDDGDSTSLRFRAPAIPRINGPSTPGTIAAWFTAAKGFAPRDRILVYFTGHGGRGDGKHPRNTVLYTWDDSSMSVKDFIAQLDKLDPSVDVTLVMVQCFAGGFANVIYNGGDPAKGLAKQHRCGFFATVASRPAAGCTPDIDGDDYQEFSVSFFAALAGQTRAGKPLDRPDYAHAGVTTLNDAFTYVLLTSDTVDVPMTTSDQFLNDLGKFGDKDARLLPKDASYEKVLSLATPAQRAALEGLSEQLKLVGDDRVASARKLAAKIDKERNDLRKARDDAGEAITEARNKIKHSLGLRWPELDIPWHPQVATLLASEGPALKDAIEKHPSYPAFLDACRKQQDAADKDLDLERKWAKVERFVKRSEAVILAANLSRTASPEIVAAYKDLVRRENESLSSWKGRP